MQSMNRVLIPALMTILYSLNSTSASEVQDKQKVFNIMRDYTKLVSCMNSFESDPENGRPTTLSDVHTVAYDKEDNSYVFYVLWGGDKGCAGGSGTMSSFVTEVARYGGDWKPYTIQNDYAFGDNVGINYGYIESIVSVR